MKGTIRYIILDGITLLGMIVVGWVLMVLAYGVFG